MENVMLSSIKTHDTSLQGRPSASNFDAVFQTDDYELVSSFPKNLLKRNDNLVAAL